jgi:hypothetical protein
VEQGISNLALTGYASYTNRRRFFLSYCGYSLAIGWIGNPRGESQRTTRAGALNEKMGEESLCEGDSRIRSRARFVVAASGVYENLSQSRGNWEHTRPCLAYYDGGYRGCTHCSETIQTPTLEPAPALPPAWAGPAVVVMGGRLLRRPSVRSHKSRHPSLLARLPMAGQASYAAR